MVCIRFPKIILIKLYCFPHKVFRNAKVLRQSPHIIQAAFYSSHKLVQRHKEICGLFIGAVLMAASDVIGAITVIEASSGTVPYFMP